MRDAGEEEHSQSGRESALAELIGAFSNKECLPRMSHTRDELASRTHTEKARACHYNESELYGEPLI